jgi:hypothetical protein
MIIHAETNLSSGFIVLLVLKGNKATGPLRLNDLNNQRNIREI